MPDTSADRYLIWSVEHLSWWRALQSGYTERVSEAGRYTRETTLAICGRAMLGSRKALAELPVREADIDAMLTAYRAKYPDRKEPWM